MRQWPLLQQQREVMHIEELQALRSCEPPVTLSSQQAPTGDNNLGQIWVSCLSCSLFQLIFRGLCSSKQSARNTGDSRLLGSVDRLLFSI